MGEPPRYRFGPLERRGLVAGWRGGQIVAVAVGLLVGIVVLRRRPDLVGGLVAFTAVGAGVAAACWPVAGRTAEEWTPTLVRWGATGVAGGRLRRSPAPGRGRCFGVDGTASCGGQPTGRATPGRRRATGPRRRGHGPGGEPLGGLEILEVLAGPGGLGGAGVGRTGVAVVCDRRARTYTGVLAVRGHSFALLGDDEKERRVAGWAAVLASLAREGALVHRLQWLAVALPDDGRAVREYLEQQTMVAPSSPARRSYDDLLRLAGASTCRHEVLVAVQVEAGRGSARSVRAAGGGDRGATALVVREMETLRRLLSDADVIVDGFLGPRALARVVRRCGETDARAADPSIDASPPFVSGSARPARGHTLSVVGAGRSPHGRRPREASPANEHRPNPAEPEPEDGLAGRCPPCAVGWPWPMATEVHWDRLHTDRTWHATYWVAEWPRVEVGPDFLAPLLLGPVRRSVSVVMEPVAPSRAVRQVEQARTADVADSELRRRGGFLATARRTRETEVVAQREAELAEGHASFRFSGYVTVTAPDPAALDEACEATEQAAGQCRLELRRLYGDQRWAYTCTLPLARGLA